MSDDFKLDFDPPSGIVIDPVFRIKTQIEREQNTQQSHYNALASEVSAIRNELQACMILERELPDRIARLTLQLREKLEKLQDCLSESAKNGHFMQIGK